MKNIIYLILSVFIYLALIIFLILKINHIQKFPEKYEHKDLVQAGNELEDRKKSIFFFKSLSHQYGMVGLLFSIGLTLLDVGLILGIQRILVGKGHGIFLGTSLTGVIALFFLNIAVGMGVIPLWIKKPFFEVSTRDLWNVFGRPTIYKRTYSITLILFCIAVPFAYFSANHYCYYDETKIGYSEYFQMGETTILYEEIDKVFVSIDHNKRNQISSFQYSIVYKGKKIDVNSPNLGRKSFSNDIYVIHQYIEKQSDCQIEITPLTEEDQVFISKKLNEKEQQIVYYIYEGFHR